MSASQSKFRFVSGFILTVLCASFFSFSELPGGDVFEIHVNNKMLIQQFVHADKTVKTLDISGYTNDVLNIYFNECGTIGKNRSISLRDGNKVLKTWNFPNVPDDIKRSAMTCKVKEILDVQKSSSATRLDLVYASKTRDNAHVLASITGSDVKASLK
jgi:hypothetical protein